VRPRRDSSLGPQTHCSPRSAGHDRPALANDRAKIEVHSHRTATRAFTRDLLAPTLLLLTATTGLVDAVAFLGLGQVFTANMTANVVFLGFAIAGAVDWRLP
jgi:hypothetical protein